MKCGYFDDANREYVITTPRTPSKWINYIGDLDFGGFVDQTGGGVICRGDPALNRIVTYIPQLPLSAFNGETLYVRVVDDDSLRVFSPFFTPTLDDYQSYECRVGLGYNRYRTRFYDILTEVTVFVPLMGKRVIRTITIRNLASRPRRIDLIPVVEFSHFDALKQLSNADWVPQTMQSRVFDDPLGGKTVVQCAFMQRGRAENYFTSNAAVTSFETVRASFLGDGGYGSWARPASLQLGGELHDRCADSGANIAALMHHLGVLGPDEKKTIITQLGQVACVAQAQAELQRWRSPATVAEAFAELRDHWHQTLAHLQVDTPSPAMNRMVNLHNPRQCFVTLNWSRSLSLYQLGLGARGTGVRDTCQDTLATAGGAPQASRRMLERVLRVQRPDGSSMHQFFPLTMAATMGDAEEEPGRPQYYGDDHLWLVLAVCNYVKETGDFEFLRAPISYYGSDGDGSSGREEAVIAHLEKAVAFTHGNRGEHGLPLLGFADWNDTVNLPAGAESMFTACLYGVALQELAEVLAHTQGDAAARLHRRRYDGMKQAFRRHGWDGAWHIRYLDHRGEPLGSAHNSHARIFANAQSWPVLSGFADQERGLQGIEQALSHLGTDYGVKLAAPSCQHYDPQIGGMTTYPPGAKENGGIFLHANPWLIIALCSLGRGDEALELYLRTNPSRRNDDVERYLCEPYCYAQNIVGDEHPQFGAARNSWLSGTASWMYRAVTGYLLGVRPACAGLRVDPCIPSDWPGYVMTRRYRGVHYRIEVDNAAHVCRGVGAIEVEGKPLASTIIPWQAQPAEVRVIVRMGSSKSRGSGS